MGIPRTEYQYWACPSDIPGVNGLAKADCPRGKEYGSNVVIPCFYHLANFPKLINIGWGFSVSEPNFTSDGVKEYFRYEFPQAIGAWILLLIKGGEAPKILPLPSISGGH